jgi:non-specific serine/threonine protein kinase
MNPVLLVPVLTPLGHLSLAREEDAVALDEEVARRLEESFARGAGHGLLQLGAGEVGTALPAVFSYWREFAARYVTAFCTHPRIQLEKDAAEAVAPPPDAELEWLAMAPPLMTGAEYLTGQVLRALWRETDTALRVELSEAHCGVQEFLKHRNPAWNLVGRVCFNLAENRGDAESPFAFLATYTVRLSAHSKAQHLPLGQALREYEGAANRDRLLSLLLPVQRATESCAWLKAMVESGEVFHPLRWTPSEATQFLRDCPQLEQSGIVVRMPATWSSHRPPRPKVTAKLGGTAPSLLGQNALLDFRMEVTLDGEALTAAEIRKLLAETDGLALVRGRWVEVDREQLRRMIDRFSEAERAAARDGLNFGEAMRMVAGAQIDAGNAADEVDADWAQVTAGPWLAETLKALRSQEGLEAIDPGQALNGTLRPYQQVGTRWLYLLAKLGLGACLADDMGCRSVDG